MSLPTLASDPNPEDLLALHKQLGTLRSAAINTGYEATAFIESLKPQPKTLAKPIPLKPAKVEPAEVEPAKPIAQPAPTTPAGEEVHVEQVHVKQVDVEEVHVEEVKVEEVELPRAR